MKKLIAFLVFLITLTIILTVVYFNKLNESSKISELSINTATKDAALVFAFNNDREFYSLMGDQNLFESFLDSNTSKSMSLAVQVFSKNESFYDVLFQKKMYCSVVPIEKGLSLLITTQFNTSKESHKFKQLIAQQAIAPLSNKTFKYTKGDTVFYFGLEDDLLCISPHIEAITQALKPDLNKPQEPFSNFIKKEFIHNKNAALTAYINLSKISSMFQKITTLNGDLNKLKSLNGFSDLSYNFSKEHLLFYGTTQITDAKNYFNLFADFNAKTFTINQALPKNTANYNLFAIDNNIQWLDKLNAHFSEKSANNVASIYKTAKEKYLLDLRSFFKDYFKDEFAVFQLETGEKLGVVAFTNGEKVKQLLSDLSTTYAEDIRIFKEKDILFSLFGDPMNAFQRPYFQIVGNYLFFSNQPNALAAAIKNYNNNETLIKEKNYISFLNKFPNAGNISIYINLVNSKTIFRNNLSAQAYKQFNSNKGLKEFHTFCIQFSGDKGKFQTNFMLSKNNSLIDSLAN